MRSRVTWRTYPKATSRKDAWQIRNAIVAQLQDIGYPWPHPLYLWLSQDNLDALFGSLHGDDRRRWVHEGDYEVKIDLWPTAMLVVRLYPNRTKTVWITPNNYPAMGPG